MPISFSQRLGETVQGRGNPVVVGLDPRWESLPPQLQADAANGDAGQRAQVIGDFCRAIIDVVGNLVPAVKPQVAFFEMLGPAGMAQLARVVAHARQAGLLVIVDAKRNDIGSTAAAYASAYFGSDAPWPADALTVSPYLGDDSLSPFVAAAREADGGIFVLVKTSNPGGGQFQDLRCECRQSSQPLYRHVAAYVESQSASDAADNGYGNVGAVVGATYPDQLAELREVMRHAWLLVPGYGSQGGGAKDVAFGFDDRGLGAVVNNSRGIIHAYQLPKYAKFGDQKWQSAIEQATRDMIADLRTHTNAGRLGAG